ncbi:MAG TPA: DUF1476 domain-containing protein [Alphaproteobacteria bacterium]|nr:DUF1476 domain-containing protein [Alphaproteobacteria bacterium]
MDITERGRVFSEKYAHDQEVLFRVESRACRLFGEWVAEKMSLEKGDAQTYSRDMVAANMEEPGLDDVVRKAIKDLETKGISVSERSLRTELESCLDRARAQVMEEMGP